MNRSKFLSSADRRELLSIVKGHREDHGIARRANALLLLDDGLSCAQIARVLFIDDDTVRGWHKQYLAEGWDAVAWDAWRGGKSRMSVAQEADLIGWLESRMCRSTHEVRSFVKETYDVTYSHSGCVKLLHRLGFCYKKPKVAPHPADPDAQVAFIKMYEGLMNTLPADEAVYFADAVHPEYAAKPGYGWVKRGAEPALRPVETRGRVNIHGALCLETFDVPFVEPLRVDGQSAVQLLAKIEARNPDKTRIHVIWDNASYHKGPEIRAFLARPGCRIHLIALPRRCPHLNPIERLWAVMHRYVTTNRFYPTQKQFAQAILSFFQETVPKHWPDFRDQVTDNFRVLSNQNLRVLK